MFDIDGETWGYILVVVVIGFLCIRSCEFAVGYAARHVNVEWVK